MFIPDVNVLIYAHRAESIKHEEAAKLITDLANSESPFGLSELVASAFIRVLTNPKSYKPTSSLDTCLEFLGRLIACDNCILLRPGESHWKIFTQLCYDTRIKGKLIADAYHAALAIENSATWITADPDFAKFGKFLKWELI